MPHAHPVTRWHHLAVALAVAAQAAALGLASSWLPPARALAFAAALGVAALPVLRTRAVGSSLALRFALAAAALALVARAGSPTALSLAPLAFAVAFWLWALHAPVAMTRWWVAARPARDGALEFAESVGLSLLATVVALTARNATLAWTTAPCLALGLAAVVWSWAAQARRRAWMRRVEAGADPAWELGAADASTTGEPWAHAHGGATRVLRARGDGEHYRAAGAGVPVAVVGAAGRAWWARRGLHAVALGWGVGLAYWGAATLMRVGPRDTQWGDVAEAMRAVRVDDDPCAEGATMHGPLKAVSDHVEVSASGRVASTTDRPGAWCVSPATARDLLDATGGGRRRTGDEQALTAPEHLTPVVCARGRWCSLMWAEPTFQGGDGEVHSMNICSLQNNGEFNCEEGRGHYAGRVSPEAARALIEAVERYARRQHPTATDALPALYVRLGGEETARPLAFRGSHEIGRELRRRLFPQSAASPFPLPVEDRRPSPIEPTSGGTTIEGELE